MTLLAKRLARAKRIEEKRREELGATVTLKVKSNKTACTSCTVDDFYNEPISPCATCNDTGYTYTVTDTDIYAIIEWISELDIKDVKAGELSMGDCIIDISVDYKSYIQEAVKGIDGDPFVIEIDGNNFYPVNYITNKYQTKLLVSCKRSQ